MGTEQRSNASARLVPGASPAGTATMRAAIQHRYGPPSAIELSEAGRPLAAVRRALTPTGALILDSGRGGRWLGPLGRIAKASVLSGFTRQQRKPFRSVEKRQDLLTLADLLTTGQVTPVIDRTHPSTKQPTPSATSAGHTRGVVVTV